MTWSLKRMTLGRQTHSGKCHVIMKGTRDSWQHKKLHERCETEPVLEPSREHSLADTLISVFLPPELRE